MSFPRATFPRITLILLLCAAVVVLGASFVGVQASPCLPSASAVRQEHPGAWPSWTLRGPGHEGDKCWYPATRTTAHNHPDKMALKKRPLEARNLQSTFERKILNHSLSISFAEVSGLDWPSRPAREKSTPRQVRGQVRSRVHLLTVSPPSFDKMLTDRRPFCR
jgi:hypothetical protein